MTETFCACASLGRKLYDLANGAHFQRAAFDCVIVWGL